MAINSPVTVLTKIDITSRAKLLMMRKRNACFESRIQRLSLLLGCICSRVSERVTRTAPATKAAGAPSPAVHSHASKALDVSSYTSPASSIPLVGMAEWIP